MLSYIGLEWRDEGDQVVHTTHATITNTKHEERDGIEWRILNSTREAFQCCLRSSSFFIHRPAILLEHIQDHFCYMMVMIMIEGALWRRDECRTCDLKDPLQRVMISWPSGSYLLLHVRRGEEGYGLCDLMTTHWLYQSSDVIPWCC